MWRVRDRLDDAGVRRLTSAYRDGATTRQLAEQFSIGMTSVKRLLREHQVRRRRNGRGHCPWQPRSAQLDGIGRFRRVRSPLRT
jgi:hypothetical protein